MQRRDFLRTAGTGIAAAPGLLAQRGANDRIGVASIGVGTRGFYLMKEFQRVPGAEIRVICDLYDGNINRAREFCTNTSARVTKEWEKAISDSNVDVVVIATPDFWHAAMTIAAAEHKKDIYVEKGWCLTLDQAKKMRKAVKDNKVMLQLGHNYNSMPQFHKAREMYRAGQIGKVPLVRTYIDRSAVLPQWKFYTDYNIHELPKDAGPDTIDWERFTANVSKRAFDPERFFRWRNWWEYSNGIAGDLMSHQWDGVNLIVGMGIPEAVQTMGGLYFWTKDRDVPDQWHVMFEYPKKKMNVTFACSFHNRHHGTNTFIFGREATVEVASEYCRLYGAEWKPGYREKLGATRKKCEQMGVDTTLAAALVEPDYAWKKGEMEMTTHQRDWIDSIRSGRTPRCGMDRAWEEAVTIVMSVESHFKERKVKWDPVNEQIV